MRRLEKTQEAKTRIKRKKELETFKKEVVEKKGPPLTGKNPSKEEEESAWVKQCIQKDSGDRHNTQKLRRRSRVAARTKRRCLFRKSERKMIWAARN